MIILKNIRLIENGRPIYELKNGSTALMLTHKSIIAFEELNKILEQAVAEEGESVQDVAEYLKQKHGFEEIK